MKAKIKGKKCQKAKRDLFAELREAMKALAEARLGKKTLTRQEPHVRYALACRCDQPQYNVDELTRQASVVLRFDDKLKFIGHLLDAFMLATALPRFTGVLWVSITLVATEPTI